MLTENDAYSLSPFESLFNRQLDFENRLESSQASIQVDAIVQPQKNDDHLKSLVFGYLDQVSHNCATKVDDHFKSMFVIISVS